MIKRWIEEGGKGEGEKREKRPENKFEGWEEDEVGPENFHVISKLGQGSFGIVYLVEKINIVNG